MTSVLELRSVRGTGGGPEKTILFGAARHDSRRFAITVCYVRDLRDDVFGVDERARTLGVDYVEVRERHSLDWRIWSELLALVRTRRIDIIHGHDYKTNLLSLLLARRTGALALSTSHGWTGHSARERWLYYPADRQLMRWMPKVIAVSTEIRDRLIESGTNPARITVLLNGIDPEAFRRDDALGAEVRAELGLSPAHQVIGTIGRLEPQKRIDLLLESFAALRPRWPDARLVIVGDGSERPRLEPLARQLEVANACLFLGHRLDVARLHNAFDLFVQSSEYEGTPNAVLEAMAMETPLVATDAGGTRELARPDREALIVPSHDVPALTSAMEAVLRDPQAARVRVRAARARIETDLSFAERTRRLEAIYEELMASRQPTTGRSASPAADAIGVPRA